MTTVKWIITVLAGIGATMLGYTSGSQSHAPHDYDGWWNFVGALLAGIGAVSGAKAINKGIDKAQGN